MLQKVYESVNNFVLEMMMIISLMLYLNKILIM